MKIARKSEVRETKVSETMIVYEYPLLDSAIHGAVVEIHGRYPETGRVVNEKVYEIGYIIKGSGELIIEDEVMDFAEGDQILVKPGERYYWDANATMFMPCAPAWYPEQHKNVD